MARNFTLPNPVELAGIIRELMLNEAQARELELVIRHAHEDLEEYYRTRISRGQRKIRMGRLRSVDHALAKLITLLGKNPELVNEDLPFDAREAIAWCASSQLITLVTGDILSDANSRVSEKEASAGLRHGARLLAAQLQLIREPIANVLAEESTDAGGLEPDHVRLRLIRSLAAAAPEIIGEAATGSAGGIFTKLVDAVFRGLNVNTEGLEKVIEHVLYRKPPVPKAKK